MTIAEALLVVALCGAIVLYQGFSRLNVLLAVSFFGLFLVPRVVYGSNPDPGWVGIAGGGPAVMTYTAAIAVVLSFAAINRGVSGTWGPVLPILVFLVVWYPAFWSHTPTIKGGLLHLVTATAAWAAGGIISRLAEQRTSGTRVVATWLLGWAAFESILCVAQYAGAPLFPRADGPTDDPTLDGRIGGTLDHPSTIGKAIFLLLMIGLPLLNAEDRTVRRRASLSMVLMIIPLVLSGGRANAAAALALVILTLVLEPGPRRWSRRLRLGGILLVAGILSAGFWAQRFETGEHGETRAHLTSVALEFMSRHWNWVTGTGPNTYVGAVGPYDSLTATGWPVHNVYLLAAVELGLIGAVLLAIPLASAVRAGWRGRSCPGRRGAQARVLLAYVPGMVMITTTGWGMMGSMFPAWMFTLGYCVAQVGNKRRIRVRLRSTNGPYRPLEAAPASSNSGSLGFRALPSHQR
jgi:hypothetical protein